MKLDNQRILELFAMFSNLPDQELGSWRGLCESASLQITRRLKENVDVKRHMERLCTAAAACAYCEHAILSGGGISGADEIRVGNVSLKNSGQSSSELDVIDTRNFFMSEIADLIDYPTGFAFRSAECKL